MSDELKNILNTMQEDGVEEIFMDDFARRYTAEQNATASPEVSDTGGKLSVKDLAAAQGVSTEDFDAAFEPFAPTPKKKPASELVGKVFKHDDVTGEFDKDDAWNSMDTDLFRTLIKNDSKYKGVNVTDFMMTSKLQMPNGVKFDKTPSGLLEFENAIANLTDEEVRKNIAFGNLLSEGGGGEFETLNNSPRLQKLGYTIIGDPGQPGVKLMRNGEEIDLAEHMWFTGRGPADSQNTDPSGENYFSTDDSTIMSYIYDNATEEDLTSVEALLVEDQEKYERQVDKVNQNSELFLEDNVVTKSYMNSPEFKSRFLHDVKDAELSEEAYNIIDQFTDKRGEFGFTNNKLDPVFEMLEPEDKIKLRQVLKIREKNKTYQEGFARHRNSLKEQRKKTFMTPWLEENVTAEMQAGAESVKLGLEKQQSLLDVKFNFLQDEGNKIAKNNLSLINDIGDDATASGVQIDYISNEYVAVAGPPTEVERVNERLKIFKSAQQRTEKTWNEDRDALVNEHGKWLLQNDDIYNQNDLINRRYGNGEMFGTRWSNGWESKALSIPALLGSEGAVRRKAELNKELQTTLKHVPTYDEAVASGQKLEYMIANAADQAPNILTAVGLTVATGGSALASPVFFGLDSAASSWVDTDTSVRSAAEAKVKLAELEKNRDQLSYEDYKSAKVELEKQIMNGDLSMGQRYGAAFATGVIEFGVQYLLAKASLGTSGWAAKFAGGGGNKSLGKIVLADNFSPLKQFGSAYLRDQAGELLEETGIDVLTQLSNSMILGTEFDWTTVDDTMVSTLATGGMMAGGNAYTSVAQHYGTREIRTKGRNVLSKIKTLQDRLASVPEGKKFNNQRAGLKADIVESFQAFGDINAEMEVAMMLGGSKKLRKLAANAMDLRQLNDEAGIVPGDTEAEQQKKRDLHVETLKEADRDSFKNRLEVAQETQTKLENDVDFSKADVKEMYGEQGLMIEEKLKEGKDWPSDRKSQLIKIHQGVQQNAVKNKIAFIKRQDKAGNNDGQKLVNQTVYGNADYKGERNRKAEKAVWETLSNNMLISQSRATALYEKQTALKDSLMSEKELQNISIIQAEGGKAGIERAIMNDPNMSPQEKQKNVELLRKGKVNGLITGGQYIVIDKVAADKALAEGQLYQGTVISHEVSHAVDALAMTTAELNDYSVKLERDISSRYEQVDALAKRRGMLEGWYDPNLSHEQQSDQGKDEYSKAVQEVFISEALPSENHKLNKEKEGVANYARGIVGDDYTFTKDQDATFYMADYINKFNQGKLSSSAKRRIKARPNLAKNLKKQNTKKSSNFKGILTDFKSKEKISSDIKKTDKGAKRKLVNQLMIGAESQIKGVPFNLQNSKLGKEAGGIIESITQRLFDNIQESELNGITRKDYKDRLVSDLSTIIINEYEEVTIKKDGTKVRNSLDNFISSRLNNRANAVAKSMGVESSIDFGGIGFKVSLDKAKNVTNEDNNDTPAQTQEKQILSLRRKLGIQKGSDIYNDIIDGVLTNLVTAGDINSAGFKKKLMDGFANAYVNKIKKLIGTPKSATYKKFLNETAAGVYSKMSLETLNQRFQYFTEAVVDNSGKQKRKNVEKSDKDLKVKSKTAGNAEFTKKPATKQVLEDWVNYFLNPQSVTPGVGRADSRRTSISEAIGVELGFDAMMEALENPETFSKFKQLSEFRGFEVSDNYLSLLSKVIDRSPGTKFSMRSGNMVLDATTNMSTISNLRNFLDENKITEGVDINPILDKYEQSLPIQERAFLIPHLKKIKSIYKEQGKTVTMKEFRESLTKEQLLAGQKLGFDFFSGFDSMVEKIGGQKRIDTTTEAGRIEYLRHVGDFTNTLDPEFLKISMLGQTFTGSSNLSKDGLRFSESKKKMVQDSFKTKDVKSKYKKNKKYQGEFKGDKKEITPITKKVEDKMLALVKKMPDNPTAAEVKALSNELNTIVTPAKRKAIQQTRDYFYTKLNDYINNPSTYDGDVINEKERLSRLAYVSTLLQAQTSSSSGIARQGAVVSSITLDYSKTQKRAVTGKDRPYQSEHNIQLLNFNGNVLKSIVKGNFDVAYPIVSSKYNQTLLDADAQSVLDSKEGKLSKEFVDKYGARDLADYIGKTTGAPGFIAGMDSESMFVVALGNASRTVDLKTGLTMDQVIYNKINANKSLDYLDGVANKVSEKIGDTKYSKKVLSNKLAVFGDPTNKSLFNSALTKSVIGINPKSDIVLLAQRIENKATYDNVKKKNNAALIDLGLATKKQLINLTETEKIEKLKVVDKATMFSRKADVESRGMSTFDFDETAGISDNFVIAKKDGETQRIASDQWPVIGDQMVKDGWKMDFSDFNKVTNGRPGPLMQKLKNQITKYGNKNVFILTARAAESAPAIKAYLESEGVSLPIENITGLGNSTGEAKAMWMLEKFAEGYNDMYFVDDALPNVKAVKGVLSQLDIKSKVVQTKFSGKADLDGEFNQMMEDVKGIKKEARFSDAVAKTKGASIGKYQFFLPPSAEDFEGLMYPLLGKGKKGDAHKAWFNKMLFQPFARANRDINSAKQRVANEYRGLKKQNKTARKKLNKKIEGTSFTFDHAARVYLWNKAGFEIPGLSKRDQVALAKAIEENPDVKAFADQLSEISQQEKGYTEPTANWVVETIASDLNNITQKVGRKQLLAEWIENKNIIFSKENLNKLESIYGSRYREALEDMLYRMENGTNRSNGTNNRLVNNYSNWVNNSVGAIMFFNGRSAVLQTLSTVNFINWSDNNPVKAAAAFANQPQYWSDFSMIFNSDMLKQRRSGLKTDVNQAELAQALAGQTNKAKAALNYLLKIGFTPTQIADSFAISAGGATFYRNRVKTYLKQGMDKTAAEKQAFEDFQEIAEKTQQSSRADMISQQQASPLGRLILAFQNTPMQYTRLIKKSAQDLVNGRGDWKTNVSKIVYYGAVQNFIFSAMQSALFATIFGAEEDDEEALDNKKMRIANTMIDSILRGSGLAGAVLSTVKNIIMTFMKEEKKGFMADHTYTVLQAINLSPPIGSKARKLYSGIQTWRFNKDVIKHKGLSIDNPVWNGVGNVIDAATNVPVGRVVQKLNNVKEALDSENQAWQRIALMLGWNTWDLGVEDEDLNALRLELKKQKKKNKKKKGKKKKEKITLEQYRKNKQNRLNKK